MTYLSLCSGIEAASVAVKPLGWVPLAFAEIDRFCCSLLQHHYPHVKNLGDIERFRDWPALSPDILIAGTPCQSFSVAGLRKGLADPRGNITLILLAILHRTRPRWLVWENVPGVRSADNGRAFGAFVGGLAKLGYLFSWRSLDAQYFNLPQRRERLFLVGHSSDWRYPASILFEPESLRGDSPPRREAGKGTAGRAEVGFDVCGTLSDGAHNSGGLNGQDAYTGRILPVSHSIAPTLASRPGVGGGLGTDFDLDGGLIAYGANRTSGSRDVAGAVNAKGGSGRMDFETETFVTHALRAHGFDASKDGTGRGTPIVAFQSRASSHNSMNPSSIAPAMDVGKSDGITIHPKTCVRRLTPLECERLQGFPDNYTLVPHNGKPAKDSPRYKAIGNSFPVPVIRWITSRINSLSQ